MCSPLAWQYLLPYCCVIVALLLSILLCVYLNRQIALVSDYQAKLMAASPAKPRRKPISTVINGRSPGTSTHRSLRILLPGYPRHLNWKSRGARSGSRLNSKRMFRLKHLTLYHIRKQIQDPRTNTLNRRAKRKQSPEQVLKEV